MTKFSNSAAKSTWQLAMFARSLKKQQKLKALLEIAGDLNNQSCLLISCGDNNGALNWYFREHGGKWTWGDIQGENLDEMSAFLGEPVHHFLASDFPLKSQTYDCVIAIDVLEHLPDDRAFLQEVKRVLRPDGLTIVTVPNGDPELTSNRLKRYVGMTPNVYGHTRAGYTLSELRAALVEVGFHPVAQGGYSRFFTELLELMLNFGYVFMLSRKKNSSGHVQIAPTSARDLKRHGLAYRLYGFFFPLIRLISLLDGLLPARADGAVIVSAVRQEVDL